MNVEPFVKGELICDHTLGSWERSAHAVRCVGERRGTGSSATLSLTRVGASEQMQTLPVGHCARQLKCGHGFLGSVGLEADLPPVRDSSAVLAPAFVGRESLPLWSHVFSLADSSVCGSFQSSSSNSRLNMYTVSTSFRISSIIYSDSQC